MVLVFSVAEYMLGPPQLRALKPCIDAARRGLHLSITAWRRKWRLKAGTAAQESSAAAKANEELFTLCLTYTFGCAREKRLSPNKDKQIRYLNLNTWLVLYNVQPPFGGCTLYRWQATYSKWRSSVADRRANVLVNSQVKQSGKYWNPVKMCWEFLNFIKRKIVDLDICSCTTIVEIKYISKHLHCIYKKNFWIIIITFNTITFFQHLSFKNI